MGALCVAPIANRLAGYHPAPQGILRNEAILNDAATVFLDPLALTYPDPYHSGGEEREITIGYTAGHQAVVVSHCERGNRVRIISARKATNRECRQY